MGYGTINIGTVANDGLGDTHFSIMSKIKDNFNSSLETWVDASHPYFEGSITDAATYAAANDRSLHITQQITLTADLDLSAVPEVVIVKGGSFTSATTKTLTLPANFHSGVAQVFFGNVVVAGSMDHVIPEWWKANAAPGTTDMTTAIQSAFNTRLPVLFKYPHDYMTSDTVTYIKAIDGQGRDLIMNGSIKYTGPQDRPALVIGSPDDYFNMASLRLKVYRSSVGDWTDYNHIGIKIYGAQNCTINIERAQGFTVGAQFHAKGVGFAYNKGSLNYFIDNKIGIYCVSEAPASGGGVGYFNENHFIGGHFSVGSTTHLSSTRYGVWVTTFASHYIDNNKNIFVAPSFELDFGNLTGGAYARAINVEYGIENQFLNCRFEGAGTPWNVLIQNNSRNNTITSGYGNISIVDLSTSPSSVGISSRDIVKLYLRDGWNSGALAKKAYDYDGAGAVGIAGIDMWYYTSGTPVIGISGFSLGSTKYIETTGSRGVGVSFDTTDMKKFVVFRSAVSGFGGRVLIKAYNSGGALLTGSSPNYVQGVEGTSLAYITQFGGGYQTGGDSSGAIVFTVDSAVASIDVIVTSGTANLKLKSFSVYGIDNQSDTAIHAFLRTARPADDVRYGTVVPVAGTYDAGTRIQRYPPAVGSPKGWYCTTTGTPGTWVSDGDLFSPSTAAVSTGVGSVLMGTANPANNDGWVEVAPGKFVPYWLDATP